MAVRLDGTGAMSRSSRSTTGPIEAVRFRVRGRPGICKQTPHGGYVSLAVGARALSPPTGADLLTGSSRFGSARGSVRIDVRGSVRVRLRLGAEGRRRRGRQDHGRPHHDARRHLARATGLRAARCGTGAALCRGPGAIAPRAEILRVGCPLSPCGPGATAAAELPQCMVRPCVARGFRRAVGYSVLHQCIRPQFGAYAPGHHGYQRTCVLITGQASSGLFGVPVCASAGKTVPPTLLILSQTSAGNRMWCYVIACSLIGPVPLFVPGGRSFAPACGPPGRRAEGPSSLAVALTSTLARAFPGQA
jgi:hypothetical protein